MTHVGLGPQHLDKVQLALEAAGSQVERLVLSSESTRSRMSVTRIPLAADRHPMGYSPA